MLNLFTVWLCSLSHEGGRSRRAVAAAVNYKEPTLGRQVLYVSHNNSPVLTCAYLVQQRSPVHSWFSNIYTWLDYTLTIFCWVGRVHWRLSWRTFFVIFGLCHISWCWLGIKVSCIWEYFTDNFYLSCICHFFLLICIRSYRVLYCSSHCAKSTKLIEVLSLTVCFLRIRWH